MDFPAQEERIEFTLGLCVLFGPSIACLVPTHIREGDLFLLILLNQMQFSSRNTPMHTPETMCDQLSGHP